MGRRESEKGKVGRRGEWRWEKSGEKSGEKRRGEVELRGEEESGGEEG